jgi:hypothetical protein
VSLVFGVFESTCGPMRKCHVADRIGHGRVTWQGDCGSGWHGTMVGFHVDQSWAATWQWENA